MLPKQIHITIRRIQSNASHLTSKLINPGTHISRMLRHHKLVVFIQIKHSKTFLAAKFAKVLLPPKNRHIWMLTN